MMLFCTFFARTARGARQSWRTSSMPVYCGSFVAGTCVVSRTLLGQRGYAVRGYAMFAFTFLLCAIALVIAPGTPHAQCTTSSPCTSPPIDVGALGGTVSNASGVSSDGSVV